MRCSCLAASPHAGRHGQQPGRPAAPCSLNRSAQQLCHTPLQLPHVPGVSMQARHCARHAQHPLPCRVAPRPCRRCCCCTGASSRLPSSFPA